MSIFLTGAGIGIAVFFLLLYGGRHEPTAHGQSVIAMYGLILGLIAAAVTWVIGIVMWLF